VFTARYGLNTPGPKHALCRWGGACHCWTVAKKLLRVAVELLKDIRFSLSCRVAGSGLDSVTS
jgi:hypothetical protein